LFVGQFREDSFDLIEPARAGGREVHTILRVLCGGY
jgi:hypothetical protein